MTDLGEPLLLVGVADDKDDEMGARPLAVDEVLSSEAAAAAIVRSSGDGLGRCDLGRAGHGRSDLGVSMGLMAVGRDADVDIGHPW
ncbi:hypothetical protein ACLOJK_038361 [Asimina triloba]